MRTYTTMSIYGKIPFKNILPPNQSADFDDDGFFENYVTRKLADTVN